MKNQNYGYVGDIALQSKIICDCLGYGKNKTAHFLIRETACAETGAGAIPDGTVFAGMGLTQFDRIPFQDIRNRSKRFRKKILNELGVDISLVEWEHLRYNSFLALLFCRLHYILKRPAIPADMKGRAKYWKKYYNTFLGKGTPEHYLKMVHKYYK